MIETIKISSPVCVISDPTEKSIRETYGTINDWFNTVAKSPSVSLFRNGNLFHGEAVVDKASFKSSKEYGT